MNQAVARKARYPMRDSALLAGLAQEPKQALKGQVDAWDGADVLLRAGNWLAVVGQKVLPKSVTSWIDGASDGAKGLFGSRQEVAFAAEDDWRLMKFCRMLDHLGLRIETEPGTAMLDELATRIEENVILSLRDDGGQSWWDRLRGHSPERFEGQSIEEAARHVVLKLFLKVNEEFEGLDEAGQRQVAERIIADVERLDVETQNEVKSRLGIDTLSVAAFRKTGVIAGLGASVGAGVALSGFGSYVLLTSTIHSIAAVVGIAVPFKFYILATSGLALLSNPLMIGAFAVGGGWLIRRQANKTMRTHYMTVLAALAVVARRDGETADEGDAIERFAAHARQRYRAFCEASAQDQKVYLRAFPAFQAAVLR